MQSPTIRYQVPMPEAVTSEAFSFDGIMTGHSLWVPTGEDRARLSASFAYWKKRTGSLLSIKTARVGESDPDGRGYRAWVFYVPSEFHAAWPKVPAYSFLPEHNRSAYESKGVADEQAYLAAVESVGKPSNVAAWRALEAQIRAGTTPYQEHLKENGQW